MIRISFSKLTFQHFSLTLDVKELFSVGGLVGVGHGEHHPEDASHVRARPGGVSYVKPRPKGVTCTPKFGQMV